MPAKKQKRLKKTSPKLKNNRSTKKIKKEIKTLKKLGFKKKYLGDKSGFWYEKSIKKLFKYNKLNDNLKFKAYVDPYTQFNHYYIDKMSYDSGDIFLKFKKLKHLIKFIKKNGKL